MPEVRLIDANALMQTVCGKECGQHFTECQLDVDNDDTRCVFRDYVKSAPTIEAKPVRHGRWIFVGEETMHDGWTYRKYKCSECDFLTVEAINFCQNCSADMMEVSEDAEM